MREQIERKILLSRAAARAVVRSCGIIPSRRIARGGFLAGCAVLSLVLVACGGSSSETPYPLEPKRDELHPKGPEVTSQEPARASDQGAPLTPTAEPTPAATTSATPAPTEPPPEPATTLD